MLNDYIRVLESAARTATSNVALINSRGKALHLVVDVTANPGTLGSITVTIQAKDPVSGKFYTLLASAAITAVGTTVYRVGPALTAAANLVANDVVPKDLNILVTANNANPMTYSIGAHFVG